MIFSRLRSIEGQHREVKMHANAKPLTKCLGQMSLKLQLAVTPPLVLPRHCLP